LTLKNRMIKVFFNPTKMPEERLGKITIDSLEKLGHTLIE
jgi:hypothetical protein